MKACQFCGKQIANNSKFCPECGAIQASACEKEHIPTVKEKNAKGVVFNNGNISFDSNNSKVEKIEGQNNSNFEEKMPRHGTSIWVTIGNIIWIICLIIWFIRLTIY